MNELLPCPFCGHDTATVYEIDLRGSLPFLSGCTTCGATIGRRETRAEAVEAWNSRPLETVLRETVANACDDAADDKNVIAISKSIIYALENQLDVAYSERAAAMARLREIKAASCLTCAFFSDGDNGMTCSNIIYPELYFFNDKDRGRLAHISCPYWESKEAKS